MDERRIHIDEFFRREMENKAEAPPPMLWDELEQRLDDKPGRKKLFPVWWCWAIIGLVVLSATGIIAGYMNQSEPEVVQQKMPLGEPSSLSMATDKPVGISTASKATAAPKAVASNMPAVKHAVPKQQQKTIFAVQQTQADINKTDLNITEEKKTKSEGLKPMHTGRLAMSSIGNINMPVLQNVPLPVLQCIDADMLGGTIMSARNFQMMGNVPIEGKEFQALESQNVQMMDLEKVALQGRAMEPINNNSVPVPSLPNVQVQNVEIKHLEASEPIERASDNLVQLQGGSMRLYETMLSHPDATVVPLPIVVLQEATIVQVEDKMEPLSFRQQTLIKRQVISQLGLSTVQLPILAAISFETDDETDKDNKVQLKKSEAVTATAEDIDLIKPDLTNPQDNTKLAPVADGLLASVASDGSSVSPSTDEKNVQAPAQENEVLKTPATKSNSEEEAAKSQNSDNAKDDVAKEEKPKIKFRLPLEGGIKAGVSSGTNFSWNANKVIIAPYVESKVSGKLSVVVQPSLQLGRAKTGTFNGQSYYEIHASDFRSDTRLSRGRIDSSVISPNPPDTVFYTYHYSQTYDSIHVKSALVQNRQWDIELPVMMKYKVGKNFAVLAGVSATYSSVLQTKEVQERFNGMNRSYTDAMAPQTFYVTVPGQQPPPAPAPKQHSDVFNYAGKPYNEYTPLQVSTGNNFFRYGFMLGASATLREVWTVEVMLHKTGVNKNAVPDKQLQKIYTQPYLRVIVGYKIF